MTPDDPDAHPSERQSPLEKGTETSYRASDQLRHRNWLHGLFTVHGREHTILVSTIASLLFFVFVFLVS